MITSIRSVNDDTFLSPKDYRYGICASLSAGVATNKFDIDTGIFFLSRGLCWRRDLDDYK